MPRLRWKRKLRQLKQLSPRRLRLLSSRSPNWPQRRQMKRQAPRRVSSLQPPARPRLPLARPHRHLSRPPRRRPPQRPPAIARLATTRPPCPTTHLTTWSTISEPKKQPPPAHTSPHTFT